MSSITTNDQSALFSSATYGNAQMRSKRTANSKVVQMILPVKEGLQLRYRRSKAKTPH
jgi:hypothetical protein